MIVTLPGITLFYVIAVAMATVVQISLDADPLVLFVLVTISIMGLLPLRAARFGISDAIFLGIVLYSGAIGLVVKAALFQPVQYNLVVPFDTGMYLLAGMISTLLGYAACKVHGRSRVAASIGTGQQLFSPRIASRLAIPVFVLGYCTQVAHTIFRGGVDPVTGAAETGFGGFGTFYYVVLLGVALQGSLAFTSGLARQKATLALMIVAIVALALISNIKKPLVDVALLVFLLAIAFRVRFSLRTLFTGAALLVFAFYILSPVIHITRSAAYGTGPLERLEMAWKVIADSGFNLGLVNVEATRIAQGFGRSYTQGGSYFYPSTANLDRFALIQPVDQVARAIGLTGTMEPRVLGDVASIVLPSALVQKTVFASADYIGWHFGFVQSGNMARLVVGMIASILAQFGLAGVVIIPAVVTYLSFTVLDRITMPLANNAWAAFMITLCSFLPEKEIDPYIAFFLRELLIVLATSWLLVRIAGGKAHGGSSVSLPERA